MTKEEKIEALKKFFYVSSKDEMNLLNTEIDISDKNIIVTFTYSFKKVSEVLFKIFIRFSNNNNEYWMKEVKLRSPGNTPDDLNWQQMSVLMPLIINSKILEDA